MSAHFSGSHTKQFAYIQFLPGLCCLYQGIRCIRFDFVVYLGILLWDNLNDDVF